MKRIKGGRKVLTGRILEGEYQSPENKLQLFDGKFTTGYRIVSFQIAPVNPALAQEVLGKLSTVPKSTVTQWFWEDVEELAWCHWGQDKYHDTFTQIRDDNLIIEDLWISAYNETFDGASVNYEIVLDKYEFTAWDGAGAMVRNQSQAGPPA